MIRLCLLVLALLAPAALAQDEQIVLGLSETRVSITADFQGSEIMIYGAVKRQSPEPDGALNVIVTVAGPPTQVMVRKKERRFGIWINREKVRIGRAPSFYAVATSGPLEAILSETDNLRYKISIPRAIRAIGISAQAENAPSFVEALERIRRDEGRYVLQEGAVRLTEGTLFRTDIQLPANLTEGDYGVRVFLTRDGRVVDEFEDRIGVQKAGIERFVFALAHEQPLIYGLLSLVLAVVAGWGASAAFRFIR
ncbi:TIGR02186 family protein [Cereibacter sphaeroides]|uniref:TIGR02186 family protein n=1 Tax=Rhodobacterales TaxID=204455 RepID=UPI000BBE5045|nr:MULTISPECIES: TIGR02186 family protein [Paracoccaceae]MCE6951985.1 TIGR02186 family protein [Cereibacter sphaeroides]